MVTAFRGNCLLVHHLLVQCLSGSNAFRGDRLFGQRLSGQRLSGRLSGQRLSGQPPFGANALRVNCLSGQTPFSATPFRASASQGNRLPGQLPSGQPPFRAKPFGTTPLISVQHPSSKAFWGNRFSSFAATHFGATTSQGRANHSLG